MNLDPWPQSFDELETWLGRRPQSVPVGLRARVMKSVADALNRERVERRWLFAAQFAAVVLIWINVSWVVSRTTVFDWERPRDPAAIRDFGGEIQKLVTELSPEEARRFAIVCRNW